MNFVVGFLAWYLAIGFLMGAWAMGSSAEAFGRAAVNDDWPNAKAKLRYIVGMLLVSMIAWFPLTLLYVEVKWKQRKERQ